MSLKPEETVINTLVIGGGGYIGSHLLPLLLKAGRKVTVLEKNAAPFYALPSGVDYVVGDFGASDLICPLLDSHQEVIHLAYATVPNTASGSPLSDLMQNLPATVQLFSEIAARKLKLLLVSSGGTVYGEALSLPIREDHITQPVSPYGVTKLTIENYARLYSKIQDLKYICVRPANAYGIGQRPFIGQGFIPTAMASIMRGDSVKVFGENGTVRDYIYVSDIAEGIVSALQFGLLSETYNLGSGVGRSNAEVVQALQPCMDAMGFAVNVTYLPSRPLDVRVNILDSTKLKLHTGWDPKVSFEDGLDLTAKWIKDGCV